ncbi:MFS transporter [Craterilacuibacter sp. RT1T]|uniref:spinster family MFS transporter n=1 Tax=Craterilacuibacter sp. RT1T TaxID=2942211 RepID=UPI0020BD8066|nr:MFS transporter [Craterilacuibacter sp. RT1T]MCL6262975.1 MFS transporter [Craterilacuibacter sp. RT1T]
MHPVAPTSWRTHGTLALLALAYVFNYIDRLLMSILIEPVKLEFGLSDSAIGLLSGLAFGLFYALSSLPLGRLADRIGPKPVIAISCIAFSAATLLCGLATSFAMLLLCRIGVAIAEAGGMAPSVAWISSLYPAAQRSRALAGFMMGPSLGAVLGLALGGWIAHHYGWRTTFIVIGLPGMILGCLLFAIKTPRLQQQSAQARQEKWLPTLRALLATPGFLWIVATGAIAATCGYAIGTWNPSFLIRSHGLTMQQAGLLAGLGGGTMSFLGTLACGWATDRLIRRDAGWQLGTALLGTLISIPFALAYFLWPAGSAFQIGSLAIPTAFLFNLGFSFFGTWWSVPCLGAISHLFPPGRTAQATSIFVMAMTLLGIGAGPLIIGTLSDFFAVSHGSDALRLALAGSVSLLLLACGTLAMALPRYRLARRPPNMLVAA